MQICVSAILENSATYGAISFPPKAQLIPTAKGFACLIEFQNASTVWPDNVLPERSVIVPEIIIGRSIFLSSKKVLIALIAAFALRVSKIVSTKIKSTPPSINPLTAS